MKSNFLTALALASIAAGPLAADRIVTKDGSVIEGSIVVLAGKTMTVKTAFAGKIEVKRSEIESFTTEEPVFVSTTSGSSYRGVVSSPESGLLNVDTPDGLVRTNLGDVTETWRVGDLGPSARAWSYEAAVDITGKQGNSDATGVGTSLRAILNGPQDRLEYYAAYNFEETDEQKSADDAKGGADYSNRINDNWNWYVRSEFGYDTIKGIDLYLTTAAGFGYLLSDTETRYLTIRGGLGYRYETYSDFGIGSRPNLNAASLDLGLKHRETLGWGEIVNRITYTPAIDDFGSFRLLHDSSLRLPLKAEQYSVRIGVSNDYDSDAGLGGKEELDTTYYIRLVLNWE